MKKSIPYAQALRYRRIIQDDDILDQELTNLQENFTNRGYPLDTTNEQIIKARNLNRLNTIAYKVKTHSEINFTPLVLTFSNIFNNNAKNNVHKTVSHIWSELTLMAPELNIIKDPKVVFKRCSAISNSLESSKFPPTWWSNSIMPTNNITTPSSKVTPKSNQCYYNSPCNSIRCLNCKHMPHTNQFQSTTNNRTFKLRNNHNCSSTNLVYVTTCLLCNIQYVGETGDTIRNRMKRHRSNICLNQNTAVAIHFKTANHNLNY